MSSTGGVVMEAEVIVGHRVSRLKHVRTAEKIFRKKERGDCKDTVNILSRTGDIRRPST
jgi:hypothetical protein